MGGEKHWVDDSHYRVVSEDGSKSWLYVADGGLWAPDTCTEVTEHHSDGTSDAYESNNMAWSGKGAHK